MQDTAPRPVDGLASAAARLEQINDTDRVPRGWYGFAQPYGWSLLVAALHDALVARHPDYQVFQVKEKFGGLRFYCSVDREPDAAELIAQAEQQAQQTCQLSGQQGARLRTNQRGWSATLCDELAAAFEAGQPLWDLQLAGDA